jgi:hypothetical protein
MQRIEADIGGGGHQCPEKTNMGKENILKYPIFHFPMV